MESPLLKIFSNRQLNLGVLGAFLFISITYNIGLELGGLLVEREERKQEAYADEWRAMGKVGRGKRWGRTHTKVLKSITLPRWRDSLTEVSEIDRLGDVFLPPRLPIDDDIRTLDYGVLFCAIGEIHYAEKQVVPMIRHLRDLGIPDAEERSALRRKGVHSGESRQGFALVASREFVEGPLHDLISFFDAVYFAEDLPAYPSDWQNTTSSKAMIKATKVHTMASSPFDRTIMLDLDSFPCQQSFGTPLLKMFDDNSDIGFTNVEDSMGSVADDRHFLGEHNSAVVVLNMKSIRTRVLMALYIQAFHRFGELSESNTRQKDQPSLVVAMQAMAERFYSPDGKPPETPNESVREVVKRHKLGFINHVDFSSALICRTRTTGRENCTCGPDSSCLIAHKENDLFIGKGRGAMVAAKEGEEEVTNNHTAPTKVFGIGFKKTATTSLDQMFSHIMDHLGGTRPRGRERAKAVSDLLKRDDSTASLALAEKHHYFQDAPWCNEPHALYRELARLHPTSKFILTVRESNAWYDSVVRHTRCGSKSNHAPLCGEAKMEKYRTIFNAKSTSRKHFIAAFEAHNEAARTFFADELKQSDRLLEMDLSDETYRGGVGWAIVCDFVGLSKEHCPKGDFPHENQS